LTELKFISPMLDNFSTGGPISDHHGIRCYPGIDETTGNKYIIKVISIPASRTQLDAFLLSGAYADEASALVYFNEQAEDIRKEAEVLEKLAQLEGYFAYEKVQVVPMEDDVGVQIYLLGQYKHSLERAMQKAPMTHLGAVNLGLDLCAALTVCRRSGYLYIDLKPSNIFVTDDNAYRIGDLGFLRLDSLKYASLPERYRSDYTAPEIADAFSSLNTTIDVYAVGKILYQIYNNGELPVFDEEANSEPLPAPANADYEMSEIILKACAPNPEDRWEDPAQMGQALVSYMQRNGANDTPIVPPAIPVIEEPISVSEETETEPTETPNEVETIVSEAAEESSEHTEDTFVVPDFQDDELGNLSVLLQPSDDETAPEYNETDVDYEEVSPEINEMLTQADEIVNHPIPEPPVAPEPIDIPIPEPIPVSDEAEDDNTDEVSDESEAQAEDTEEPHEDESPSAVAVAEETEVSVSDEEPEQPESEAVEEISEPEDSEPEPSQPKKKSNWLLYTILALLLVGLLVVGVYFYKNYYLLPIDSLVVEGKEDYVTVTVETPIDESLLTVECKGQHGDVLTAPLKNGQVTFTDLKDDTGYVISLNVSGFHKLTGETSKGYSTPKVTKIASFQVYTGSVSGSVDVVFTVTGKDADSWQLISSATGEATKTVTLQSKNETISGLTVGKEYTFTLKPTTELYLTGETTITAVVHAPAFAQHLAIDSCKDGKMVVSWQAPKSFSGNWTVSCKDASGSYTKEITVNGSAATTATFDGINQADDYTITVTAEGMQSGVTTTKAANAPSLSNVKLTTTATNANLTWESEANLGALKVTCTADGLQIGDELTVENGQCLIENLIPGTNYCITVKTQDGTTPIGGIQTFTTNDAEMFSCSYKNKTVTAEDMTFRLCTPPFADNWTQGDLADDGSDYTNEFKADDLAGIVIQLNKDVGTSKDIYTRTFAIYDQDNRLVAVSETQNYWHYMWLTGRVCTLSIPTMPKDTGEYTLRLFFNGQLVTTQEFTITE